MDLPSLSPNDASLQVQAVAALRKSAAAIRDAMRTGTFGRQPRVNRFRDDDAQFAHRIDEWLELLIRAVEREPGFAALLSGQTVMELIRPELDAAQNRADAERAVGDMWAEIAGTLSGQIADATLGLIKARFDDAMASMLRAPRHHVRTLLIGDCLMGETAGLAADATGRAGISFDPFPINARDPAQLDRSIERLANAGYDAVFFSPFSHARLAEIEALLDPKRALQGAASVDALVGSIIEQTGALIAYLGRRFECPIYLHNAALAVRATSGSKAIVGDLLTARRRRRARARINTWLQDTVAARNAAGPRQFHIIDEDGIAAAMGRRNAGRYVHDSEFQHATRLSLALSAEYARRIEMLATLKGRKLVICDLDHTLWDGIIGEGGVSHFADRQQHLRRLKEKSGIVLSIASKNDPANVHFTGGVLGLDDFVAPQISWGTKADAIARIQKQLNLQYRHMVFIDDRPDERAFVAECHPDVLTLDATDPESWRQIALWADATEGSSDLDRTKMYQQQVDRDAFVGAGEVTALDRDVIERLGLTIAVRAADKPDLKRFAELINRTNQWNLTGSRTTAAQVKERQAAPDAMMLLASVSDKFGDMGDVCAATVLLEGGRARIEHFVLSCRVFGYGVESAMLNHIRAAVAERWPGAALAGSFVATTQNHMARDMYADAGFADQGDGLFLLANDALAPIPA